MISGVTTGGQGGQSAPLTAKHLRKIGKRGEKIRKKREKEGEKSGKKSKNREGSFTLPLLTDRTGYADESDRIKIAEICFPSWMNMLEKRCILMIYSPFFKKIYRII